MFLNVNENQVLWRKKKNVMLGLGRFLGKREGFFEKEMCLRYFVFK